MASSVEITMTTEDGREVDFTFTAIDNGFDHAFGYQPVSDWEFCEACDQDLNDIAEDDISYDDHLKAHEMACAAA